MAARFRDLTGQRFSRLTVVAVDRRPKGQRLFWVCQCDCGRIKAVRHTSLVSGSTHSCGCLQAEIPFKHGLTRTPEWIAWSNAIRRCVNPRVRGYHNYGGRGVSFCPEWRTDFRKFYEHLGPRPSPDHSLDRINNDGNYEPGNVRWATRSEQRTNQRRSK